MKPGRGCVMGDAVRFLVLLAPALLAAGACDKRLTDRAAPAETALEAGPDALEAPEAGLLDAAGTSATAELGRRCEATPGVFVFVSPVQPAAGVPMRILAVSDRPLDAELSVSPAGGTEADRKHAAHSSLRRGGPPFFWTAEVTPARAGTWTASLGQSACAGGEGRTSLEIAVTAHGRSAPAPPKKGVWPTRTAWNRDWENVYSAWIEALFDAPDTEQPSWPALHHVLRDPKRNLLFDYLGAREDSSREAPFIRPDCADLPYFLRAYFAWKVRLPFGLAECSRGGGGAPPYCRPEWITNEDLDERAEAKKEKGGVAAFGAFIRGKIADTAHSGSARTPFTDETSDYYPVALTWDALRPGTVYADPYGHVLVVAKRVAQTAERGGVLYAVDGQPDGTVARKRFWRGNFLYANAPELGGPGFKRFRPIGRRPGSSSPEHPAGELQRLGDAEILRHADYGDLSLSAAQLGVEAFYDAMDDALSPRPQDPAGAMTEAILALEEQVRTRVTSVENGRTWLERNEPTATMPPDQEIFETSGAWEDFATPSRDLRLLIAIDVVRGFPGRVARRLARYAATAGRPPAEVEAELEKLLDRELSTRSVTYTRTNGQPFSLTLREVLGRAEALEMAYNLNDCVEVRWGAPAGSEELATCRKHAPAEQRTQMQQSRAWFHERRRPARK